MKKDLLQDGIPEDIEKEKFSLKEEAQKFLSNNEREWCLAMAKFIGDDGFVKTNY
jgi:hypothetical protein|tara:strand:+ start:8911 stop:9075 length:165 start_codon:yes stop_codon:yes gene_type:complete